MWLDKDILPDSQIIAIARDDDYFFGILHSKLHELWALRQGSSLEDRPRYTPTSTFETFPFPWPPGREPSKTSEVFIDDQALPDSPSGLPASLASQPVPAPLRYGALRETSEVSQERARALEHAIAEAARDLVQLRDAWLNPSDASEADLKKRTLTNLYNARPTWLDNAHRKLDAAVFAAYGWPSDLSDDDILARLLALNLER